MTRSILYNVGVVIGLLLGVILRLATAHRHTVVEYAAVDAEHGPVYIEVTSSRLTGRMTRRVYSRDP